MTYTKIVIYNVVFVIFVYTYILCITDYAFHTEGYLKICRNRALQDSNQMCPILGFIEPFDKVTKIPLMIRSHLNIKIIT